MDLLLSNYSDLQYVMDLEYTDGVKLINKCYEKIRDKKIWEMWLTLYPNMDKKSFMSFEQFKKKILVPEMKKKELTAQEIIERAETQRLVHQGLHKGIVKKKEGE